MTIKELLRYSDQEIDDLARNNPNLLRKIARESNRAAKTRRNNAVKEFDERKNRRLPLPEIYQRGKTENWRNHKFTEITDTTNIRTLRRVAKENIRFLSYKSSTFKGWQDILQKTQKRVFTDFKLTPKSNVVNEFWRIVNFAIKEATLTKYRYNVDKDSRYTLSERGKKVTEASATKELQQLVWQEMQKTPFKGRFKKNIKDREDDDYAMMILKNVETAILADYERRQELEREEEAERGFSSGLTLDRRGGY